MEDQKHQKQKSDKEIRLKKHKNCLNIFNIFGIPDGTRIIITTGITTSHTIIQCSET